MTYTEPYIRWSFFGRKVNRLVQVMSDLGVDIVVNCEPWEFCAAVHKVTGPIDIHQHPERWADIALHRIAQ